RLKETYARYYVPNNAALIVTGDVTEDRVVAAARHHFGDWKRGVDPFADRPIPPVAPRAASAAVLLGKDVLDVTIVVALQGPSVRADPAATYAADALFGVFNDAGSPFQRRLVDTGPFLSVSGNYLTLDHTGPIELRGKTTPEHAQQALLTLLNELDNLDLLDGVTDEDLAIVKKRREVATALTVERTAERPAAAGHAHSRLRGRRVAGDPADQSGQRRRGGAVVPAGRRPATHRAHGGDRSAAAAKLRIRHGAVPRRSGPPGDGPHGLDRLARAGGGLDGVRLHRAGTRSRPSLARVRRPCDASGAL